MMTKNPPYFFNLENHRQSQKSISELVDEQGVRHSTHKEVMKHIADFYEDLYTFEPMNAKAQETLLNTINRYLPEEVSAGLEGPLTLDECYWTMAGIERRKSPGSDGIPVEFYLLFWEITGQKPDHRSHRHYLGGRLTEIMGYLCWIRTGHLQELDRKN